GRRNERIDRSVSCDRREGSAIARSPPAFGRNPGGGNGDATGCSRRLPDEGQVIEDHRRQRHALVGDDRRSRGERLMRVLVVEDDAAIATVEREALEREGYEVSVCSTGGEAIGAAASWVPDLSLLEHL